MNAPVYREQDRFAEPKARVREAVHSMSAGQDWLFHSHELQTSIDLADGTALVFHDAVLCLREKRGSKFRFLICPLDIEAEADTTAKARQAAGRKAWDETKMLLHTPSHTLEIAEMERKGLLLGYVDVVKSRIAEPADEYTWVLGSVQRPNSTRPFFLGFGSAGEHFDFDSNIENVIPDDQFLRMAKVRTDNIGIPRGPVIEIGMPLNDNPEETWNEWQTLMDDHD